MTPQLWNYPSDDFTKGERLSRESGAQNVFGQVLVLCYLWGGVAISQDNGVRVDSGIGHFTGRQEGCGSGLSYQSQPDTEPTITGCENLVSIHEPQFLLCKMCKSGADISSGCEYSIS